MTTLDSLNIPVRYADAHDMAHLADYGTLMGSGLTDHPESENDVKVYDLSRIGAGNDLYSQTTTWQRANYRALRADYPDVFVDIEYSNVVTLGILSGTLDENPDLVDLLAKLADEYPIYSDEAVSELEDEEIMESIGDYVTSDIRHEFADDETRERWDALDSEVRGSIIADAMRLTGYYPEHNGLDVLWRYAEILPAVLRLMARATDNA